MSREDVVGSSLRGTQKNIDTKSNSARRVAVAADGLQLSAFRVSKDEFGRGRERHTTSMRRAITLVKIIQIQQTSQAFKRARALVRRSASATPNFAPIYWHEAHRPIERQDARQS